MTKTKLSPEVKKVFDAYPKARRRGMIELRELVFDIAHSISVVGELEETLKWGEPAYLTTASKSGTTIRIDWKPKNPDVYAVYFSCQTNLIERFRDEYPSEFQFEGNRAIMFAVDKPLPVGPLSKCLAAALTYHLDKRKT